MYAKRPAQDYRAPVFLMSALARDLDSRLVRHDSFSQTDSQIGQTVLSACLTR